MDDKEMNRTLQGAVLPIVSASSNCCSSSSCGADDVSEAEEGPGNIRVLNIDLLVIDMETCARCVPTGGHLEAAVTLLSPVADALGIELSHRVIVVQTQEEAKQQGLLSSPTIRLNGQDIDQDIRESVCESCGDLTSNNAVIDCREWHYRGKVYFAAPLPMLLEAIMGAMLRIDSLPPVVPTPLERLPENLQMFFDNKKQASDSSSS
jgi:hypothetical protein